MTEQSKDPGEKMDEVLKKYIVLVQRQREGEGETVKQTECRRERVRARLAEETNAERERGREKQTRSITKRGWVKEKVRDGDI